MEEEFELAVTWWPYELHPETPREGRDVSTLLPDSRLSEGYRQHLKQYAAEAGITLASRRVVSNSHRALELAEFARDRGAFVAVHEALFHAYFEVGDDIGDEAVLARIATDAGLDLEEWAAASRLRRYAALVDESTGLAREKGFTATPTVVIDDRFMITGAQDELVYRDVLRRLGATPRPGGGPPESPG